METPGQYRSPFEQPVSPFGPSSGQKQDKPPDLGEIHITAETLKEQSSLIPESVFLLGSRMDYVAEHIRLVDKSKHLGLGNIIDSTPPYWIHLNSFHISNRMVTNADYMKFLHYKSAELSFQGEPQRFYNSADLWDAVWTQMDLKISSVRMPMKDKDGQVFEVKEDFVDALNFVHAYVKSLFHEIGRMLMSVEEEADEPAAHPEGDVQSSQEIQSLKRVGKKTQHYVVSKTNVANRLLAYIKWKLKDSILASPDMQAYLLTPNEIEMLKHYTKIEVVLQDIDDVINSLRPKYQREIDKRLQDLFKRGIYDVETILFLKRFRAACIQKQGLWDPIGLEQALYPRNWPGPYGEKQKFIQVQLKVKWEDLPVTGITLYEAVAYCLWLKMITGLDVMIPNEFQYERAASWPLDHGAVGDEPQIMLDPRKKELFPWESHNKADFNYYFGKLESLTDFKAEDYKKALSETAKNVGGKPVIQMLLGFGWHWTIDRYDESERKYNRFESTDYPVFGRVRCLDISDADKPVKVYEYRPNSLARNNSLFVLRGSPQVIGGPGATTRRFSAFPLRGNQNVGFRFVFRSPEAS
jgi:formylglycine-generating enzyme required for sulfatase activity